VEGRTVLGSRPLPVTERPGRLQLSSSGGRASGSLKDAASRSFLTHLVDDVLAVLDAPAHSGGRPASPPHAGHKLACVWRPQEWRPQL